MGNFVWDSSLETGHPDIDEQHRSLFELAEKLDQAITTCALESCTENEDAVADGVYGLSDYCTQHFVDEESLMARVGFPGAGPHKAQHDFLTGEVMKRLNRFIGGEDLMPDTLAPLVTEWLTAHIGKEDRRLVEFIRSRE